MDNVSTLTLLVVVLLVNLGILSPPPDRPLWSPFQGIFFLIALYSSAGLTVSVSLIHMIFFLRSAVLSSVLFSVLVFPCGFR